jgi:hypothetical protein
MRRGPKWEKGDVSVNTVSKRESSDCIKKGEGRFFQKILKTFPYENIPI